MIARIFENTKPINFIIILIALLIAFSSYEIFIFNTPKNWGNLLLSVANICVLLYAMFLLNVIVIRWKELSENPTSYAVFFFSVLITIFPDIFQDIKTSFANLLIISALWQLLTLKSTERVSLRIFDASFFVAVAGVFNPWALLFLVNIWISLFFYGSKKRKFWLIPFVALFCVFLLTFTTELILGKQLIINELQNPFEHYFESFFYLPTLVSLAILLIMLIISVVIYFFKTKYHTTSSQTMLQILIVTLLVAILSKEFIFVFAPLSVFFAVFIEKINRFWLKETILWIFLLIPIIVFSLHFWANF